MVRRTKHTVGVRHAVLGWALLGLLVGALAAPAGAAVPGAQQGVTKDEIEVVLLIPDLDALKAKGINVSGQSNAEVENRVQGIFDSYGPVNGRKVVIKSVGWDPLDVTSFDKACTAATQDNKPFAVINSAGYSVNSVACISVDNKTPFISGDMTYNALQKASGKNLLALGLPSEVAGTSAADLVAKTKSVPKTAKIGIVSSNLPGVKAAADALEAGLKKKGYDVVSKVEVNGLASDAGTLNRETAAAADTFQASGVDTVFNTQSFTQMTGFFGEADKIQAKWKVFAIDGQSNTCTPFSATRTTPLAAGATCITAWDAKPEASKDKLAPDNAFEAKCRKAVDATTGKASLPGGPSGGLTVNGATYNSDIDPKECTIAGFLMPAIKKAGKDVTWDKVYANLVSVGEGPTAYLSQGKGSFAKDKPYYANPVLHLEQLQVADSNTAKDANGLFNGCSAPVPCWATTLVNGQDWFPVSTKAST